MNFVAEQDNLFLSPKDKYTLILESLLFLWKKGVVIKSDFGASFGSIGLKGGNLSPSVLTESEQGDA